MPRKTRFYLPGVPVHAVQRGHSREAAERYHCAIHAYVLMTNHVHILATLRDSQASAV